MSVFPALTSLRAKNPLSESIQFRTIVSEYVGGDPSTKQGWLFPRRSFKLNYFGKSLTDARTLWAYYLNRKGKHLPFVFFLPFANTYVGEYVGTGDGSTTLFNLPSLDAASYKVYVNAVEQASGSDYTFTAEDGTDGEDTVEFVVAPGVGEYVTFDFTGYLKVRCKFADDMMDFDTFFNRYVTTGLKLQGLLNA